MKKNARILAGVCLFTGFMITGAFAAQLTTDPNAAIRKLTSKGQDTALAEFERIQRLNNEAAITYWNSVLQKNPKDANAYAKRGKALGANKDYDKALIDYNRAIELDPKTADAYVGRAVARFFKGDYAKSWEDVHQAEGLGGKFWPSFMDALKVKSGRDK